jgi:hypothetical protein
VIDDGLRFGDRSTRALLVRRIRGESAVDEWGLDPDLIDAVTPLARLRWTIDVTTTDELPLSGAALLVYNRRFGVSEHLVLASAVWEQTGRPLRFVGVPDRAPLGPLLRRVGGALDRTDEIAGLLRAGALVGLPLGRELLSARHAGNPPVDRLRAPVQLGVPVLPVALFGFEVGWRWRVVVGPPVEPPDHQGPLAVEQFADRVRDRVQGLLEG